MGVFRQMACASFKVNDRGETLFFAPLFFFWERQAYVLTSDDDVALLKRKLGTSNWMFFVGVIPAMVVVQGRAFGDSDFVPILFSALFVGAVFGLAIRLLVIRRAVRNLERSSEGRSFKESLETQAASFGWRTLLVFASVGLAMIALGIFSLSLGRTAIGICAVVLGGWIGLHHAYLMSMKSGRTGGKPPAT